MNDYDTPEIRCSLRNLSRVTEWLPVVVFPSGASGNQGQAIQSRFHCEDLGFLQGLSNEIITSAVSALKKKVACVAEKCLTTKNDRQKIKKKDVERVSKISSSFKPNTNVGDDEKCENPTESQIIEMPHRSSEEKLKPCMTSSLEEPMQASASRTFSLQQFQPKEGDTKVSYSDTVTLQSFDQRKFSAQKYESQYSWLYFSHEKGLSMQVLRIIWCFIIRIPLYKQRCGSWYTSHQNARHPQ